MGKVSDGERRKLAHCWGRPGRREEICDHTFIASRQEAAARKKNLRPGSVNLSRERGGGRL